MKKKMFFLLIVVLVFLSIILVTGCVSKPGKIANNETAPLPTVPPAHKQLYIEAGQLEQFTYRGHNIAVNYTSAHPTQIVKVTLDGSERIIQKEPTENPIGMYWKEGNLSFTLKPVVWEIRDSQKIPFYEKTWNTTELYFEVFIEGT